MKLNDLFENFDIGNTKRITSSRTNRVTIKDLISMREAREKRKLEKIKDRELYYQMYGNKDSGDGDGGGMF